MSVLTLSPDERVYAVALVALASTSAATLAGFVHTRRRAPSASFLPTYAATMGIVAALALMLVGTPTLELHSPRELALALLAGAIACLVALLGEARIVRVLRPRFGRGATGRLPIGLELVRPDLASAPGASSASVLAWLLVVGVGEEVLFRGVLVDLARLAPGGAPAHAALLAASVVAFSLSHVQLGFGEALSKLPLSIACLAACLVSGTILAPIAAHVGYNAWMWRVATLRRRVGEQAAPASAIDRSKR